MIYTTTDPRIDPEIKFLLDTNPDLSIEGWSKKGTYPLAAFAQNEDFPDDRAKLYSPEAQEQIWTAIKFCRNADIHPKVNSYVVKHAMERWARERGLPSYISNGCAIAGAMVCGYKAVKIRNSLNCYLRRSR